MLSEQEKIRRDKLLKLVEYGINPYPANSFETTTNSDKIKSDKLSNNISISQ